MTKITAGHRLRAQFDDALVRASREAGRQLEWTESETVALQKAIESADNAERVKALLDAELAQHEPNPAVVTKLSAEWRLLNKAQMDYVWRLNPGMGVAKNPDKVRAGRARWTRQPPRGA
jgi:hypothetical protein